MTNLLSCVVSLYGAQAQTVSLDGTIGETPRMPMYSQVAGVQTQQMLDDRSRDGGALGWRLKGGRGRGVKHLIPVFAKGQLEAELHIQFIHLDYILFLMTSNEPYPVLGVGYEGLQNFADEVLITVVVS